MTDDNKVNDKVYRTLEFYRTLGKKVHINIIAGGDAGLFRNGYILDISYDKQIFIFIDDILGERPYLFEEVDIDGIVPYQNKKGARE